ncbi:MAG: hypothetical protein H7240_10120 [Glaciimonas sp.]|nr:hypothetical protein [Glaciimonas sp.]
MPIMRYAEKMMSLRLTLLTLCFSTFILMAIHAAQAAEINLNIKDQGQASAEFFILSVALTPPAMRRLVEASHNTLQQKLMISLDGNVVSTPIIRMALQSSHLKSILSQDMASNVFPSLLTTPVKSISLSGFSMQPWTLGK